MKSVTCLIGSILIASMLNGQTINWQNKDLETDHEFGISVEKAYGLVKNKKPKKIIVAVIDSGIDTTHEDLKPVLSKKGWGILGQVQYDNIELVRILRPLKKKFENPASTDTTGIARYRQLKQRYAKEFEKAFVPIQQITGFKKILDSIVLNIGKTNPVLEDFKQYQPVSSPQSAVTRSVIKALGKGLDFAAFYQSAVKGPLAHYETELNYHLNLDYRPVERGAGNDDLMGADASHGTHVARIIGAVRNNGIGLDGIADHVEIMSIRTVPDGDERDLDVAAAIRYAAKHGARVINMSFGKAYATDKAAVDAAVKYAIKKDVLLVQAAGNDGNDIDTAANFPNRRLEDGTMARGWIVVGASGWKDDGSLAAPFSNYGKTSVDVFAPGERIWSSVPGSKYDTYDGTSMAAPVVAGLAALIREYYPKLKAERVKGIIMASAVKREVLKDKCVSGGVVNAYEALKLASLK